MATFAMPLCFKFGRLHCSNMFTPQTIYKCSDQVLTPKMQDCTPLYTWECPIRSIVPQILHNVINGRLVSGNSPDFVGLIVDVDQPSSPQAGMS